MASQSRKHRGYRSQKVVAEFFARHGWPFAESTGAGRSGTDITGMPGLAPEVKARSDLQPLAWLKQAEVNPGLPFVIFRPNGMGEQSVGQWGVLCRLETFTELLREANYGSPEQTDDGVQHEREEAKDDDALDAVLGSPADLTVTHDDSVPRQAAD
jgi:hypothetical protein